MSEDKFSKVRPLFDPPEPKQTSFEAEPIDARVELIRRGRDCFKWMRAEYAIAKNVFREGHPLRTEKLAQREDVGRWMRDVIKFLEYGEVPEPEIEDQQPPQPQEKSYGYPPAKPEMRVIK
jgi:hypothetical protein